MSPPSQPTVSSHQGSYQWRYPLEKVHHTNS